MNQMQNKANSHKTKYVFSMSNKQVYLLFSWLVELFFFIIIF